VSVKIGGLFLAILEPIIVRATDSENAFAMISTRVLNSFNARAWPASRLWRWALCALALALLQGCSAIKLGYNKADDLAYWWLDGYADFSQPQSERLRAALTDVHRWHRTQELPAYAALLLQTQNWAADNITALQVCTLADAGQLRLNALTLKAMPALTAVALDLSGKQLLHLERQWAKKNATWQDDWLKLSMEEREKKRLDNFVDRFESFYGTLTPTQIQLLQQQVQQSVWTATWSWQVRLRQQQQLMELLRSFQIKSTPAALAQEALQTQVLGWASTSDGYGFEMRQRLKLEACTNAAQLHNITSPAQRQKAMQRLRAFANDFKDLSMP
jgi:hypothetical protein